MAKDVVFESEKYEKRVSRNRWLIPLLGVLGVLLVVVLVYWIIQGSKPKAVTGGEDTPYPYSWTVDKAGVVTLELDSAASPGYAWQLISDQQMLTASPADVSRAGKTVFTLTPTAEGRAMLSFVLQGETDRIYELDFLTETVAEGKNLSTLPVSVSGYPIQGRVDSEENSALAYTLTTDEDGDFCIIVPLLDSTGITRQQVLDDLEAWVARADAAGVTEIEGELDEIDWSAYGLEAPYFGDPADSDWDCESSLESVAMPIGVIYTNTEAIAYVRPGTASGKVTLRMFDAVSGACITVECAREGSGGLQVLSHRLTFELPTNP